jgi:hypothetical protein
MAISLSPKGRYNWLAFGDLMIRRILLPLVLLVACCALAAQDSNKESTLPSPAELQATTARGRMLADYDVAAWHATDAVEALKPDHTAAPLYLARKIGGKWEVVFGRPSPESDKFLVLYRASQGATAEDFSVKKFDPPADDRGYYFHASKAIETAAKDFGKPARPYNKYVIPSENGQLYVYFLPAQTAEGVYPLGGDVRYTVTLDGSTIAGKRQMHKSIVEKKDAVQPGQTLAGGYHSHALSNDVEDSDVFHVLTRSPSVPEIVGTPDKHVYEIHTDGSITREK